jgi:indole-3-glycerol phosphate synthase
VSDVLAKICAVKREAVARRKVHTPLAEVEATAKNAPPVRDFAAALSEIVAGGDFAIIAEIKKASPSAGLIRANFSPAMLAAAYERGGAACLSVLTEEDHFSGDDSHLQEARFASNLPILRKDFMLEPYQITEARAIGADCVLLIMAALDDSLAAELDSCAQTLGMAVLIEVHDEGELERALKLNSPLIGVNNRNLKTLQTDLAVTERLAAILPKDRVLVAESGLKTREDLTRLAKCGARRFLIGESLMRQTEVETATRDLVLAERLHA